MKNYMKDYQHFEKAINEINEAYGWDFSIIRSVFFGIEDEDPEFRCATVIDSSMLRSLELDSSGIPQFEFNDLISLTRQDFPKQIHFDDSLKNKLYLALKDFKHLSIPISIYNREWRSIEGLGRLTLGEFQIESIDGDIDRQNYFYVNTGNRDEEPRVYGKAVVRSKDGTILKSVGENGPFEFEWDDRFVLDDTEGNKLEIELYRSFHTESGNITQGIRYRRPLEEIQMPQVKWNFREVEK